jgi:hypothetical protein
VCRVTGGAPGPAVPPDRITIPIQVFSSYWGASSPSTSVSKTKNCSYTIHAQRTQAWGRPQRFRKPPFQWHRPRGAPLAWLQENLICVCKVHKRQGERRSHTYDGQTVHSAMFNQSSMESTGNPSPWTPPHQGRHDPAVTQSLAIPHLHIQLAERSLARPHC